MKRDMKTNWLRNGLIGLIVVLERVGLGFEYGLLVVLASSVEIGLFSVIISWFEVALCLGGQWTTIYKLVG